jgi:hypothetical protein
MTDEQQGTSGAGRPDVGSVGEEAAKLFGVLSGWAREQGQDQTGAAAPGAEGDPAAAAHHLADALTGPLAGFLGNVNEHIATGGGDCRFCPVCQVIHAVRETNPDVRQQLSSAASSLLHAAAGLLATQVPEPRAQGVEKIDLSDDTSWDEGP